MVQKCSPVEKYSEKVFTVAAHKPTHIAKVFTGGEARRKSVHRHPADGHRAVNEKCSAVAFFSPRRSSQQGGGCPPTPPPAIGLKRGGAPPKP